MGSRSLRGRTEYKDVARCFVHQPAAPLERRHPPDTLKCAGVLEAVQGQAPCGGGARLSSLTASARAGVSVPRSGRGKACGAVELEKWSLAENVHERHGLARTRAACPGSNKKKPLGTPLTKMTPYKATRFALGMHSRTRASRGWLCSRDMVPMPVTFPPGRSKLETRPVSTGSDPSGKTMGMELDADLAA
jgi:hypothetical protein